MKIALIGSDDRANYQKWPEGYEVIHFNPNRPRDIRKIRKGAKRYDQAVVFTKFVNHAAHNALRSSGATFQYWNGSLSGLVEKLPELFPLSEMEKLMLHKKPAERFFEPEMLPVNEATENTMVEVVSEKTTPVPGSVVLAFESASHAPASRKSTSEKLVLEVPPETRSFFETVLPENPLVEGEVLEVPASVSVNEIVVTPEETPVLELKTNESEKKEETKNMEKKDFSFWSKVEDHILIVTAEEANGDAQKFVGVVRGRALIAGGKVRSLNGIIARMTKLARNGVLAAKARDTLSKLYTYQRDLYRDDQGKAICSDAPRSDLSRKEPVFTSTPSVPSVHRNQLQAAKTFLRKFLMDGPKHSSEILAAAKHAGIGQGTLYEARGDMRIRFERQPVFQGGNLWMLRGHRATKKFEPTEFMKSTPIETSKVAKAAEIIVEAPIVSPATEVEPKPLQVTKKIVDPIHVDNFSFSPYIVNSFYNGEFSTSYHTTEENALTAYEAARNAGRPAAIYVSTPIEEETVTVVRATIKNT